MKMSDFNLIPLVKNFYTISRQSKDSDGYVFDIELDEKCPVYQGHFPTEPIAPGVCNIQMIKECAEYAIQQKLQLKVLQRCRFLKLITPQNNRNITVKMTINTSDEKYMIAAQIVDGEKTYLDLKGDFVAFQTIG